jgi:hypothetical protein
MSVAQFIDTCTVWALFIGVGALLNSICQPEFRTAVGARVFGAEEKHPKAPLKIGEIARLYINNTIFRFFRKNPLTLDAFYRSILLSISFLVAIFVILCVFSGIESITAVFSRILDEKAIWVFLFLAFIILLDWLSFLQTYLFMKFASVSGFLQIIFVAYADLILSVNIFLFIFPLSVVAFILGHLCQPFQSYYAVGFFPIHSDRQRQEILETVTKHRANNPRATSPDVLLDDDYNHLGKAGEITFNFIYSDWKQTEFKETLNRPVTWEEIWNSADLLGAFRYDGLQIGEVASLVADLLKQESGAVEFNSEQLEAALEGSYYGDGSIVGLVQTHRPTLKVGELLDPKNLAVLYSLGFAMAQQVQTGMPEILWKSQYLGYNAFSPVVLSTIIKLIVPGAEGWLSDSASLFWVFCDQNHTSSRVLGQATCHQMAVVELMRDEITQLTIYRHFQRLSVPLGVFLLGSLCCTVVFYVSLFVFLLSYYLLTLLFHLVPRAMRMVFDIQALRANSILILVAAFGLPVSVIVALNR